MRNPNALKWSDLKTGIFFIFGIGFAAYLGLVIGKNSSLFTGVTTVKVLAGNMQGLTENNFVSVSGKKVGTVSKMEFTSQNDSLLVVADLRIRNEYANLVTKDSKATIRSLGVLGDKYVDIMTGKGEPVQDGDFIALDANDGMAGLTTGASKALENINTLLEQLQSGKGVAGRLISDEKMGSELVATISSLRSTADELATVSRKASSGNGLLPKLINDPKLADNTTDAIAKIQHAAATTDSLMTAINSGEGTLGQLRRNPELYDNLTKALSSLDTLMVDLKKRPERYVRFTLF
ncbi:MlaD family protein [Pelodictyon luteolum]|uniref:VpsC protein n=1 Tax=Chlorobium luteolum (strain DSM 273 / BCRC 81028 / 2530) TaxID=319225 RepID=Q3B5Q3_CHLL3|nr:MCE family protein [Pelodictyon luteolum]ABB23328.1 VpsC protein [Pelodictyon luteolum DSM 273]